MLNFWGVDTSYLHLHHIPNIIPDDIPMITMNYDMIISIHDDDSHHDMISSIHMTESRALYPNHVPMISTM